MNIIIEDEQVIVPNDYESKYKAIKEVLHKELFGGLTQENTTDFNAKTGMETKKRAKKNEIMPVLTTMQVSAKLNESLRVYRPLSLNEIKSISQTDLMSGFKYFMQLISYINTYVVFVPDKQMVSGFLSISTNSYNELMQEPSFSEIFASIEDYLVSMNFVASQSNLVDSKTTVTKLQAQGTFGHSMIKSVDALQIMANSNLDRQQITDTLQKFKALTNKGNK